MRARCRRARRLDVLGSSPRRLRRAGRQWAEGACSDSRRPGPSALARRPIDDGTSAGADRRRQNEHRRRRRHTDMRATAASAPRLPASKAMTPTIPPTLASHARPRSRPGIRDLHAQSFAVPSARWQPYGRVQKPGAPSRAVPRIKQVFTRHSTQFQNLRFVGPCIFSPVVSSLITTLTNFLDFEEASCHSIGRSQLGMTLIHNTLSYGDISIATSLYRKQGPVIASRLLPVRSAPSSKTSRVGRCAQLNRGGRALLDSLGHTSSEETRDCRGTDRSVHNNYAEGRSFIKDSRNVS